MYFTLHLCSVQKWFVRQFDCHRLKFEGVCDSQIGNKNSFAATDKIIYPSFCYKCELYFCCIQLLSSFNSFLK